MRAALLVSLVAVMAMATTGCLTAVGQTTSTATGASPRAIELESLGSPDSMAGYKSVVVERFDPSMLESVLPPEIPDGTQSAIIGRLMDSKQFEKVGMAAGTAPVLLIRGQFTDYEPGGSALRAIGLAENPFLSAHVVFIDQATGRKIGAAIVRGTIKSVFRAGQGQLEQGVAKAVADLVKSHFKK